MDIFGKVSERGWNAVGGVYTPHHNQIWKLISSSENSVGGGFSPEDSIQCLSRIYCVIVICAILRRRITEEVPSNIFRNVAF